MGIAVNIDSVGTQQFNIVGAEKITHTQPTYYNPISTRYQDADEKNKKSQVSKPEEVTEKYSAEEAIAHNAQLPGALQVGVALTQEQASAYNAKITGGAAKVEGNTLTAEEAASYNATLKDAVKAGDRKPAKTPAEQTPAESAEH